MKKKLCGFLALVMILTSIAIPSGVAADGAFAGDYVNGDTILDTFDASSIADGDFTTTGEMATVELAGETYVKTNPIEGVNKPNMSVTSLTIQHPAAEETIYIKFRFHAAYDNDWEKTVYFYTNGGKRGNFNLLENIEDKADNCAASAPGTDVIIAMTTDGFTLYSRMADSDGAWTPHADGSGNMVRPWTTSSGVGFQFYRGLAVSSAQVYKKQAPEVAAVNTAAQLDAAAMKAAIEANYTALGIDLSLLEGLNALAVYAEMLGETYESAEDIASAFEAAVQTVASIPVFAGDYAQGDNLINEFDATNEEQRAAITLVDSEETVRTTTYHDETYVYAERVNSSAGSRMHIPMQATYKSDETVYVKMRLHSQRDNAGGKNIYMHTNATKRVSLNMIDSKLGDWRFNADYYTCNASSPSVDVIFALLPGDNFKIYTREVGSDGEWASTYNGTGLKAYDTSSGIDMSFYYGLAVNNIKVYTKLAPEVAAVNVAASADAAAMKAAIEANAVALGIDLSLLDGLNALAVYAEMLGETYESAEDIASAFEAAVQTVIDSVFDGDYVDGYKVYASFDANNAEDIARATATGPNGVATAVYGGDTYVYSGGGSGWLEIPMCPGFISDKTLYIKFRTHAITDTASGDKSTMFYFANTHRISKSLQASLYQTADNTLTSERHFSNIFHQSTPQSREETVMESWSREGTES